MKIGSSQPDLYYSENNKRPSNIILITGKGGGGSSVDSIRKSYPKRARKRSNSDDGSSDGEHTLELASSHSSDEDEATPKAKMRSATLGMSINPFRALVTFIKK